MMGDKPKRDRFEAGKKGDVQWKEAVKNWKMRKSETNKASYKDLKVKQQEHAALELVPLRACSRRLVGSAYDAAARGCMNARPHDA